MEDTAELHRSWVLWLMRRENLKITPLSVKAGLSDTTLKRYKEINFNGFEQRTIKTVCKNLNVPGPEAWAMGMSEDDAEPWEGETPDFNIAKTTKKGAGQEIWIIKTDDLLGAGIKRGDQVLFDLNLGPKNGDIVLAQHYDMTQGAAKTILRLYNYGRLTRALMTGEPDDILTVDPTTNVSVVGVMLRLLRQRPA